MIGYVSTIKDGIRWRENQGGLLPLLPSRMMNGFSEEDARDLLKNENALFIRWETEFEQTKDTSWWHVVKYEGTGLSDLSSNTRSKVRRGLKSFQCEPIAKDVILDKGYEVYTRAFTRYQTHEKKFSSAEFADAIKALPKQTELWGVWDKKTGRLVAFSENYVEAKVSFYNTIWFEPSALRKYCSYALFYEMNRHYLEERNFEYVSDGARSLSHDTQIHDFLESKFGFRKVYARLNVVYVPWLSTAVAVAYPFRNLIQKVPVGPFKKASVLLKQEEIRRECAKVKG